MIFSRFSRGFLDAISPKTLFIGQLLSLNYPRLCDCVAKGLATGPKFAVIGSSNLLSLKRIKQVQIMNTWMWLQFLNL